MQVGYNCPTCIITNDTNKQKRSVPLMPTAGTKITTAAILNDFNTRVINVIKLDAYHSGRLPIEGGYECIPPDMLDNINNIVPPYIGKAGQKINANDIYNNLVSLTANLTRMGTFSWIRRYKSTIANNSTNLNRGVVSYAIRGTLSGKAFFKPTFIRTLQPVGRYDVNAGNRITAKGINDLIANIFQAWNTTAKYHYPFTETECHYTCHCHTNCNCNCNNSCYND